VLFDRCADCRRCCHVEAGYPSLEVTLTRSEKKTLGSVCIEGNCQHLGPQGCSIGDAKPFGCKLYPLSFDPTTRSLHYDVECPLMPDYIEQLADRSSDASLHLRTVSNEIRKLSSTDPEFLAANHAVDLDYFELKKLPHRPLFRDRSK